MAQIKYKASTLLFGYLSTCVWGASSVLGRMPLVRSYRTLKQDRYKEILQMEVIPFMTMHHGSITDIVFQQDNRRPHRARSIKCYLDAKNISGMKWPATSSDLNPIKNVWHIWK